MESLAQDSGRDEGRECKSTASDKSQCSEPKEHQAHGHRSQTCNSAGKSVSTMSSEPRANVWQECYTIDEAQSELIERNKSQMIDNKEEGELSSSPRGGLVQGQ